MWYWIVGVVFGVGVFVYYVGLVVLLFGDVFEFVYVGVGVVVGVIDGVGG